jgi:hypothetical protein
MTTNQFILVMCALERLYRFRIALVIAILLSVIAIECSIIFIIAYLIFQSVLLLNDHAYMANEKMILKQVLKTD